MAAATGAEHETAITPTISSPAVSPVPSCSAAVDPDVTGLLSHSYAEFRPVSAHALWHANPMSQAPAPSSTQPNVAAVAAKAGLLWLRPAGASRSWPAWQVWHDEAIAIVSGPGEQELPELNGPVRVVFRAKAGGARLLALTVTALPLAPTDPRWQPTAHALAASRLNSAVPPAELPAHWRSLGVQIIRLEPGELTEFPGNFAEQDPRAAPIETPATTGGRRPWHLGGRRRRSTKRKRFSLSR